MPEELGDSGGVGGESTVERKAGDSCGEGGRYVMPMALCNPVTSRFVRMHATVTSPGVPVEAEGGIAKRVIVSEAESEKVVKARTRSGSKYFHALIFLAAAGSARMMEPSRSGGSCRRVASWQ